jgi:isoleucyl-tRNA synthetase
MISELSFLFLEIQNQTDLLSLSGKTLCVTAGSAPSPINSPTTLLCQYINLQLLNAEPQGMCFPQ